MTEFLPENPVLPQDAGRQLPLSVTFGTADDENPRPRTDRGSLSFEGVR
jgi:hypothetical protein